MTKAFAQYSCNTATFIEVKDSCEQITYYHEGSADRWFVFHPDTMNIGVNAQWYSHLRLGGIIYDSLFVYTGTCGSLNEFAVYSPVPDSLNFSFNGTESVYLRFVRFTGQTHNTMFGLCVFNIRQEQCMPSITLDLTEICLGECIYITNNSNFIVDTPHVSDITYFTLTINPPAQIWDALGTYNYGVFGTISGGQNQVPSFINTGDMLMICPITFCEHTIHAQWFIETDLSCEYTVSFNVYDTQIADIDIFADPCELVQNNTLSMPAYYVPCCVENIGFSYTHTEPKNPLSINWIFHDESDFNLINYYYFPTTGYVQGDIVETNIATIITQLDLNCLDTFYLSMIINGKCIGDTVVTTAFILLPPKLDFVADKVCLGNATQLSAWVNPDCIDLWKWDFGDGTIITGQNLQNVYHTYSNSGTFNATLTVYYHDGLCSVVVSHPVIVIQIEKPQFSIPWDWACPDEIVFTIDNFNPNNQYTYSIGNPLAAQHTLYIPGALPPHLIPMVLGVEIPWPGLTGGIIYIHVTDANGCYAYDSLMIWNCCADSLGNFYYNHTFSGTQFFTGQTFFMNGTINFKSNYDYGFSNCNFYFSPNTKMVIPDGVNVFIVETGILQACEPLMWDGIYVYGTGSLTINSTALSRLLIQDAKNAVVSKNGGHFSIARTTFDRNYNHLAVYSHLCADHTGAIHSSNLICTAPILPQYPPVVATRTRFAIEVSGVRRLTIGVETSINQRNLIENCDVGIYSRNSFINVRNNLFRNINPPTGLAIGMPNHPRGYGIYTFSDLMKVPVCGGIHMMYDRGINTIMTLMQTSNRFENCFRGIFSFDNKIVNISRNHFDFTAPRSGHTAIEISAWILGQAVQKNISMNHINRYRFGIKTNAVDNVRIDGNIIQNLILPTQFLLPASFAAGIVINGGNNLIIDANRVLNPSPVNLRHEGIRVNKATNTTTQCNILRRLGRGIHYRGYCFPARIKKNRMIDSHTGFALSNNGITGQQGIPNQPWDNTWEGTSFTNHLYTMNNTFGNNPNNHWHLVQHGTTHWTSQKHPNPLMNNADGSSIEITIISTPGRLNMLCAFPMLFAPVQVPFQMLMQQIALDQAPGLQHPAYRRWFSRDGLMRTIDANPHLQQNNVLQNFRQAQQFESTGRLEIVRDTVSRGYITQGRMLNDAIQAVSEPDTLAKSVNRILLNADFSKDVFFADFFSSATIDNIKEYALLCPFVHGDNVYLSRVMLSMMGDTTEYWNECELLPISISGKSLQTTEPKEPIVLIYPNPARDYVTIETDMPLPAILYLYNAIGQKIDEIQIVDDITIINMSKYNQQLIFYQINGVRGIISIH